MVTAQQLAALKKYDSPTICNAIERFNIRSYAEGYLHYAVKAQIPCPSPMIGYAATAKFTAKAPATPDQPAVPMIDYYRWLQKMPRPNIAVFQDLDYPQCKSAMFGEVMALIHTAVGCSGVVTNGGLRDIKEVSAMDFGYFGTDIMVSHAYLHCVEYNCPVDILGTTVRPEDLLFCDNYGIVVIPEEIVPELPKACAFVAGVEAPVIAMCKDAILNEKELDCDKLETELSQWFQAIGVE